ncbi:hypothetical protein GFB64_01990 [Lacticaseibacillus paracasei]|nr:hypothetical protein F8272_09440 [Lacticaseibacillus paracasei]MCT3332084.1 hypothetical protein [Lacticaseibacillus paracasei]QPB55981.1 hypothetical protein GFB64_01990 [Lacticaseibacillus paracasei]
MQTTQRPGLELMLLGDFETGLWARSAVSALASRRHPSWPEIAEFGTARFWQTDICYSMEGIKSFESS